MHIRSLPPLLWKKALAHKFFSIIIALAVLSAGYYTFRKISDTSVETRYILAAAERGTLVISVSGTGQVSVSDQVDLRAKVSGDVVFIGAKNGQAVKAGALLVQLDTRDAQKAVRDAEVNLESAELALEKLKQSSADIEKIKEDAFSGVSNLMLDLPTVMTGLENILHGTQTGTGGQWNIDYYKNSIPYDDRYKIEPLAASAEGDYQTARKEYEGLLTLYKGTSRYAESSLVNYLLDVAVEASKSVAESLKSVQNLLDFFVDYNSKRNTSIPSVTTADQGRLKTYIVQVNGHLLTLINFQNTVKNFPLDIKTQELTVKQRENALQDAKEKLADYYVRALFAGVVADVPVDRGDSVSSGAVVATLITREPVAEISLNEVDVAQIKAGAKTILAFDAVPDVKIAGEVDEIDTVGVISAGVVSYTVKINFTTENERIKPGMTVSADIASESKSDVLLVPNSAVKSQGGFSYVEVADVKLPEDRAGARGYLGAVLPAPPRRVPVKVGLSNEEVTEILSGLTEGDIVIAGKLNGQTTRNTPGGGQQSGGFRLPIPGAGGARSR